MNTIEKYYVTSVEKVNLIDPIRYGLCIGYNRGPKLSFAYSEDTRNKRDSFFNRLTDEIKENNNE